MPENIKALFVILLIAFAGFTFAKKASINFVAEETFNQWRKIWFIVTIAAFTIPNIWVFFILCAIFIPRLSKSIENKAALYFFVLFAVPIINEPIPGGINLFLISYQRILALVILLPAAISISKTNNFKFGSIWTDRLILIFILLYFSLVAYNESITEGLRKAIYGFTDIVLPYYVISRSIKNLSQVRVALVAFLSAAFVFALIGTFESVKSWLLYNSVYDNFGIGQELNLYVMRGEDIRAIASFNIALIFAFYLVVAMGFYLFMYTSVKSKAVKRVGLLILLSGLLAPLSRGPWVGAVVVYVVYTLQGSARIKKLALLLVTGFITFIALHNIEGGQKYLDLIPFYGQAESDNVVYRQKLFDNAMIVISRYPLFGSYGSLSYLEEPEMVEMIQGERIVDIVNTYLLIGLTSGYVGLTIYVLYFLSAIIRIQNYKKYVRRKNPELHNLGSILIAILISIMVMISSVSSVGAVPVIYTSVIGLSIAYTRIVKLTLDTNKAN
jgi:hypothetical protein